HSPCVVPYIDGGEIILWREAKRLSVCAAAARVVVRAPVARITNRPAPCAAFALAPLARPPRIQSRGNVAADGSDDRACRWLVAAGVDCEQPARASAPP